MLSLDYGADVPAAIRELLVHHARALGVPLSDVEEAGRDLASAEAFILHAEERAFSLFATTSKRGIPAIGLAL